MHNCPAVGKWSIAVWEGESGTAAADALAVCGEGSVAAAYSLDAQTGAWSRWFAGKPEVSNLPPLSDKQGVLALDSASGPAATATPAATPTATPTPGATGQLQNCPAAGKWSIAVWDGQSGTAAADALATCGVGAVDAAYALDQQTGAWSRWFAGKPEVSNLPPFSDKQGVLALGSAPSPTPTPSPSPTPTPSGPAGPVAGATYVGKTSQNLLMEFGVAADGLGIDRVKFGFEGFFNGNPCVGLLNMSLGRPQAVVDAGFTIDGTDYTMTGRFDSATTASGELEVHVPDSIEEPGCLSGPLTWTASAQ